MARGKAPTSRRNREKPAPATHSELGDKIRAALASKKTRRAIVFGFFGLSLFMLILSLYLAPNAAARDRNIQEQRLRSDKTPVKQRTKTNLKEVRSSKSGELGGLILKDGEITVDPNGEGASSLQDLLKDLSADELNAMLQAAYQQDNLQVEEISAKVGEE